MHLLILLFLCVVFHLDAKIRILTFHYNLPELIEIQHKTLQKYVSDDYELIVFNDAKDPKIEKEIQDTCNRYGILCIRFEPEWHLRDPLNTLIEEWERKKCYSHSHIGPIIPYQHVSVRHCHVLQYALDNFGRNHNDLVVILDGDCFPVRPLSLRSVLGSNAIAGIRKEQGGIEYLWVVFTIFNPQIIPNDLSFRIALINNEIHDTGSYTHLFLKNHPEIRWQQFRGGNTSRFYHKTDKHLKKHCGFTSKEIALLRDLDSLKGFPWPITVEFHVHNNFIHLGNSASGLPGAEEKMNCIKRFLNL